MNQPAEEPPAGSSFYIPPDADASDVLAYAVAAYHDRPPAGQRMRMETLASVTPAGTEGDDQEMLAEVAAELTQSIDIALDTGNMGVELQIQSSGLVIDLRALLLAGLYYHRPDLGATFVPDQPESVDPDHDSASAEDRSPDEPIRWNQLIDWRELGMPLEEIEEFIHPERTLERLAECLADPEIHLELGPDQGLPRGEAGALLNVVVDTALAYAKLLPASRRASLEVADPGYPMSMRLLVSRETGYLHREEATFNHPDFKLIVRTVYYGHEQPVHVSAPAATEVNPLLSPESVVVESAAQWCSWLDFVGRSPNGDQETYVLMDLSGPLPAIEVGDQVVVDYKRHEDDSAWITRLASAGPDGVSWTDKDDDEEEETDDSPRVVNLALTVVEVTGETYDGKIVIMFADERRQTIEIDDNEPRKLPASGERLVAYRRLMPEGPELISLRRGDEIVWEESY